MMEQNRQMRRTIYRGTHNRERSTGEPTAAPVLPSADLGLTTQGTLMAVGVEPDRIRCALLEAINGTYRLAAWLGRPRDRGRSPASQTAELCQELGRRLNRQLWDETRRMPFLQSEHPLWMPPIEQLAVTMSPIPHLRVAIVGLTREFSVQAAQEAVTIGPAHPVGLHAFRAGMSPQELADHLRASEADALLLVGGYDPLHDSDPANGASHASPPASAGAGEDTLAAANDSGFALGIDSVVGTAAPLYAMLQCVADALGLLEAAARPVVYFAGSRVAANLARQLCGEDGPTTLIVLPNLTPAPGILRQNSVAQALHLLYAARARQTPGYAQLAAWSNSGSAPKTLESNFARLVRIWREVSSLSELHGLYLLGDARIHVWASAQTETIRLHYDNTPESGPQAGFSVQGDTLLAGWPPVQLVCGSRRNFRPGPTVRWWDRGAMSPVVAALGEVAPVAVRQVIQGELLIELF